MITEMVLSPECFVADFTGVGTLIGVRALVDEEVVALREATLTVLADELLLRARCSASTAFWVKHEPEDIMVFVSFSTKYHGCL